jgi:anti-sigma regulatory factor (Ser/Thr protein kinase)
MAQHLPHHPDRSHRLLGNAPDGGDWIEIEPVPEAVAHARRTVRERLTHADPDFVYNVELVTSELVTNAIRCVRALEAPPSHGPEPAVWIAIVVCPRWAHLRVRDSCPGALPHKKQPAPTDVNGRGMLISEAVADLLWVEPGGDDKVVHAVLAKPGTTLSRSEVAGFGR